ncbi:MAG: hypothetical protein AB1405_08280, partial [Bdellovibrionota bacterium]
MARTLLFAVALFLVSPLSLRAQSGRVPADKPKTLQRTADAMVVSGDPLSALWGKKLDKMRLFSLQGGAFAPIPYQIDKRGTEGDYLIPQASMSEDVMEETGFDQRTDAERRQERIKHFEKKRKDYEENVAKGKMKQADLDEMRRVAYFDERPDELDYNDELVLMARDLGDRVHRSLWPTKEGIELEVEDPLNGEKAWAYLLYFPTSAPPASPKDYVKYDPKGDMVEGQYAKLDFIDNKPLILEQIVGKMPNGGTLPNILDRFKLRIKIKPRLLFCAPLRFDENNTKSFTIGYKDGPVRVIRRNIFWITFGGLKVPFFPKAVIYYVFYDNALIGPTEIYNPFNPKIMPCGGSHFTAGVDLRKSVYGIELYTQDNPSNIVVDGKMNETEKNIVRA